jgi:hypothetical protein
MEEERLSVCEGTVCVETLFCCVEGGMEVRLLLGVVISVVFSCCEGAIHPKLCCRRIGCRFVCGGKPERGVCVVGCGTESNEENFGEGEGLRDDFVGVGRELLSGILGVFVLGEGRDCCFGWGF